MRKSEILDQMTDENYGYLQTAKVVGAGISKTYLAEYIKSKGMARVAQGLYRAPDAWDDNFYIIQHRYPRAIFSHETALYLLDMAEREPLQFAVTMETTANGSALSRGGIKVYKIKEELLELGVIEARTPVGHIVKTYNRERTLCDLVRSRSQIEVQDFQGAFNSYIRSREKNLPLLMRYAKEFSVDKIIRQYLEVLLP